MEEVGFWGWSAGLFVRGRRRSLSVNTSTAFAGTEDVFMGWFVVLAVVFDELEAEDFVANDYRIFAVVILVVRNGEAFGTHASGGSFDAVVFVVAVLASGLSDFSGWSSGFRYFCRGCKGSTNSIVAGAGDDGNESVVVVAVVFDKKGALVSGSSLAVYARITSCVGSICISALDEAVGIVVFSIAVSAGMRWRSRFGSATPLLGGFGVRRFRDTHA